LNTIKRRTEVQDENPVSSIARTRLTKTLCALLSIESHFGKLAFFRKSVLRKKGHANCSFFKPRKQSMNFRGRHHSARNPDTRSCARSLNWGFFPSPEIAGFGPSDTRRLYDRPKAANLLANLLAEPPEMTRNQREPAARGFMEALEI
jgi:hypothetical protein